ncbi:MAG: MFS transporter [Clostridioides sp.]|jgi:sugar phosphate permease|nr:MFS transporter [Clostridioides sp.]
MASSNALKKDSNVSSYRWVVWGILVVVYLTVFFHRLSTGVIVGNLEEDFGMSATQIANLGSMYFYAYTVMQIPTGILVDYLGPKKTVIAGSVIAAAGSIMFSYSEVVVMAYISRLIVGLGVSVVFLSILKIQGNWFPPKEFATMSGVTSFVGSLGGLLAQTPLIAVIGVIGWRWSFRAMGIVSVALAVLVMLFIKNRPGDMGLPEVNPILMGGGDKATQKQESIPTQLGKIVKNPRIWGPAIAFGATNGAMLLFTGTFGVQYLVTTYAIEKTAAANIISLTLLCTGISCLLAGTISDRMKSRKKPMIGLALLGLIGWVSLVFIKGPLSLAIAGALLIGFSGSIGVVCWSNGQEVCDPKVSGMAMSIVNVFGFLFAAVVPVICGKVLDGNMAAGMDAISAFKGAFMVPVVSVVISLVFAFLAKETGAKNIYHETSN